MKAIFIDGVGRTRHMLIDSVMPYYQFPRHREMAVSFDAAPPMYAPNDYHRFNLLKHCTTFCVFGFEFESGPQYKIFKSKAEWSSWMGGDYLKAVWDHQDDVIDKAKKEAIGNIYTVAEFIRPDVTTGVSSRLSLLVARVP